MYSCNVYIATLMNCCIVEVGWLEEGVMSGTPMVKHQPLLSV